MNDEDSYGNAVDSSLGQWSSLSGGFDKPLPTEPQLTVPRDAKIIDRLGEFEVFGVRHGGHGEVYLCVRTGDETRMPIALKSYKREFWLNPEIRRAFQRECSLWLRASVAPGIFPLYGLTKISGPEGRPFIRMPSVLTDPEGKPSLRDLLNAGPLPLNEAVFIARNIAGALAIAAKVVPGLVHGDLKPANILIWNMVPYVSDFGLARVANLSLKGNTLTGTHAYCSPLALNPKSNLSVRDDIYSFGVILEEMLTGRNARQFNDSVRSIRIQPSDVEVSTHSGLYALAQRCRATNPGARPSDFKEVFEKIIQLAPEDQWPSPRRQGGMVDTIVEEKRRQLELDLMVRRVGALVELEEPEVALGLISRTKFKGTLDWRLWRYQGMAFSLTGKLYKAIWCYQAALDVLAVQTGGLLSSDYYWTQFLISDALLKGGKKFRAIRGLKKLLSEYTDQYTKSAALHLLARAYVEKGWFRQAEWLLIGFPLIERNAQYWNDLGVVYLRLEDFEQAAHAYKNAIELEGWNAKHQLGFGQATMMIPDRIQEAFEAIRRAIGCDDLTPTTFVCAFVCAFLLRDLQKVKSLRTIMRRTYTREEVCRYEDAALQKAKQVPFSPFVRVPQAPSDRRWVERGGAITAFRTDTARKVSSGEEIAHHYKIKLFNKHIR
jgi:tetratricopeptide (TPR) repeat protein